MKIFKGILKVIFFICLIFTIAIFGSLYYLESNISKDFRIKKGDSLSIDTNIPITAEYNGSQLSRAEISKTVGDEFEVELKMFGIIPFSTVNVQVVDELQVEVLGTPFGMKLYTEGVLVIELTQVQTAKGVQNPAKDAGIKVGDYIISVDGIDVHSNEDLSEIVEKSQGKNMDFVINRNGKIIKKKIKGSLSKETNSYKIGIWIRDSSAGIGMLTFYSPSQNIVCGLGHGICDEDTGTLFNTESGQIIKAEIIGVEKGESGSPGQLKGVLEKEKIGDIDKNSNLGVYSVLENKVYKNSLTEIALKQDIKNGKAQIFCTVKGDSPSLYNCEIQVRSSSYHSKTQNMIVTITDDKLLEVTGGIVQGM